MRLKDILDVASKGYPDNHLSEYYDGEGNLKTPAEMDDLGDGLARFVVVEIAETYDADASDEDQLYEARRVLGIAICEIEEVLDALS